MSALDEEVAKRRTFAIISHPDAGKTTVTEKLLYLGGAINVAGTVKARKSARHATSDWMEIEQQRGISVTSSVMQFEYDECVVNLLDTPGHEDFSEDTYRTLTAVDSALMVIDAAKGVEDRTIKLLEVCRLRKTPVITLINKLDRFARDPLELLDEIESVLKINCAPITWPVGSGTDFAGVYHLSRDVFIPYKEGQEGEAAEAAAIEQVAGIAGDSALATLREEIELVEGAGHGFAQSDYLEGNVTPVFFGSALRNFGIRELLDHFVEFAPAPLSRETSSEVVEPKREEMTGFIFKIQANMDPNHRDRIAFMRVCSGKFTPGMKLRNVRSGRDMQIANPLTFLARGREHVADAYPGDIIGVHNHGTIQIGDSFTQKSELRFRGIPNFAPELFRRVRPEDPLKSKALLKGLTELCEEGAAQVFKLTNKNEVILGAVGMLQFDVVAWRLRHEYNVECIFEGVQLQAARWVRAPDEAALKAFCDKQQTNVAIDGSGEVTYLAPTNANLQLTIEKWPDLTFERTRESNN